MKFEAPFGHLLSADLPLDQSDSGFERRLYIQVRGFEQVGVGGRPHGGAFTAGVAGIAALDVLQNRLVGHREGQGLALDKPALGSHLGAVPSHRFWRRLGADHGADVAAVEHGAARLRGKRASGRQEGPSAPAGCRRRGMLLRRRRGRAAPGSSSVAGSRLRAAASAAQASVRRNRALRRRVRPHDRGARCRGTGAPDAAR